MLQLTALEARDVPATLNVGEGFAVTTSLSA